VACAVAWVVLVLAAINFGHVARGGEVLAWAFTGCATVGAIGCLLLMFSLVARAQKRLALAGEARADQRAPAAASEARPRKPPARTSTTRARQRPAPADEPRARRRPAPASEPRPRRSSGGRRAAR
jgi:hypothetical protein